VTVPSPGEAETAVLPRIDGVDGSATAVLPQIDGTNGPETAALPRIPAEPSVPGEQTRPVNGWWRRNRWGLVALVPALALALGPSVKNGYERMTQTEPRRAVVAGADGWVPYAGARMRLAELTATTESTDQDGKPLSLPEGVRVWRARVFFEMSTPEGIKGCSPWLEDHDGRLFSANPIELTGLRLSYADCGPDSGAGGPRYEKVFHFVMPESSAPAALRVVNRVQVPRYARMPAG
jgi:hypothetical protein